MIIGIDIHLQFYIFLCKCYKDFFTSLSAFRSEHNHNLPSLVTKFAQLKLYHNHELQKEAFRHLRDFQCYNSFTKSHSLFAVENFASDHQFGQK